MHSKISNVFQKSFSSFVYILILLLIGFAIFLIPLPKEIGLIVGYSTLMPLLLIALLYPFYYRANWARYAIGLSLLIILFALPLSGLWSSGISTPSQIGGLLPFSDANGYYYDARSLLAGNSFSSFSTRRPLFAGTLAGLLGLTQQNLQLSLAIFVVINSIASFLLSREVKRTYSTSSALLLLCILFIFYRRFAGITLTENIGFALGAIGLAILWRGASSKHLKPICFGIFLLALALISRAGTFFVLPCIVIWGCWTFKGSRRFSFLIGSVSSIFLAFLINSLLIKIVGSPDGAAFSNFSTVLYGLVHGGNWNTIYKEHPDLLSGLSEAEQARAIYDLVWSDLKKNPWLLVKGFWRAWDLFLFKGGAISFLLSKLSLVFDGVWIQIDRIAAQIFSIFVRLLSAFSLITIFRKLRDVHTSLLLALMIGILASVPFVPPWDADGLRVYAATIPCMALFPAMGLYSLRQWLGSRSAVRDIGNQDSFFNNFSIFFGILLASFVIFSPLFIKVFSVPRELNTSVSCPSEQSAAHIRLASGSYVELVENDAVRSSHLPKIRIEDFRNGLHELGLVYPEFADGFKTLDSGTILSIPFDIKDRRTFYLIADSALVPSDNRQGVLGLCLQQTEDERLNRYFRLMEAKSVRSLP